MGFYKVRAITVILYYTIWFIKVNSFGFTLTLSIKQHPDKNKGVIAK